MKSIFLSHNRNDKPFVRRIGKYLSTYGVKCWIDEAEIKIGESLLDKINTAINECDYFGIVLSRNSINSEWVRKELNMALQKEKKYKKLVILPILIDNTELPSSLSDKLSVSFANKNDFELNIIRLIDSLGVTEKNILDIRNQSYLWHEISHTVIINDVKGKIAKWTKETAVTPIKDDIYLWFDEEIHGSGNIEVLSTNIGSITKISEEGGVYTLTTEFDSPLPRDRIVKKLEVLAKNCFTNNKESFTWIPIGQFDSLVFKIVLPLNRPFKNEPKVYGYYGTTKLQLKNCMILFELNKFYAKITQPLAGIKYLLEWEW